MGQAKHRRAQIDGWKVSLSPTEVQIAEAAQRLLERFIEPDEATGMCYRMTFLLHLYLAERGIGTTPVVGYVNDGTDDAMISHAWLGYEGKKTDLTLARAERPDLNPLGEVLILDFPVRQGHKYTYHITKSEAATALEEKWLAQPRSAGVVLSKRTEHEMMAGLAQSRQRMRVYLDNAPDRLTYRFFSNMLDRQ